MRIKYLSILLLFLSIGIQGCDVFNGENEPGDGDTPWLHGMASVETGNEAFPYFVQHQNGEVLLLTQENGAVNGAIYFLTDSTIAQVYVDDQMRPKEFVLNNEHTFLFENYEDGKVDIAWIHEDEFEVAREIEINLSSGSMKDVHFGIDEYSLLLADWNAFFGALGTALSGASCAISVAITAGTLGAGIGGTAVACGGAIMGAVSLYHRESNETISQASANAGTAANFYGCLGTVASGNPALVVANCINTMIDGANGARIGWNALRTFYDAAFNSALGYLLTGDGDVKFNLTWNNDTDLDLYVTEPNGETLWYGHTQSATGGKLDRDDIDGHGPENIFWPTGFAPIGEYRVEVKMFRGDKDTVFRFKPKVQSQVLNSISGGLDRAGQVYQLGSYFVHQSGAVEFVPAINGVVDRPSAAKSLSAPELKR